MKQHLGSALGLMAFPLLAALSVACGGSDGDSSSSEGGASANAGASSHAGTSSHAGASSHAGSDGVYLGPTLGTAQPFAALAYSAISAANLSPVTGDLGVSAGAMSNITGFDAPTDAKYGIDSLAPDNQRTNLAQQDVTALTGDIDSRACDADYTDVLGGLTGDITLHPGVTCMNSFSADVLLNGHVTLDAENDPNAFFVIRSNLTLTAADGAEVVLANGAQACSVFWSVNKQVTIGKTVRLYGTLIAGTAITMKTGSTLVGRALAQTAAVALDANTITIPTDCSHLQ
ncbi:MAG TPA: ice-binding family protein [Polyangiaceae bacterium]|nr:ice-binding family protein [Polyangiaceae bacterium]